ncbi:MAG: c-type cytochrome [Blastocatellia bacterium]
MSNHLNGCPSLFARFKSGAAILALVTSLAACSSPPPAGGETVTKETRNPLTDPAAAAAGKPLFAIHCASCHGDKGKGDGIASDSLAAKPSDLSTGPAASTPDGALFLILRDGMMVDGKFTMPPTKRVTDEQLWQVVAYLRTLAAK